MNEEKPIENVSPPVEPQTNAAKVSSILSRLDSKKEDAAVNLGISASEVETLPFDLSALETEGIFLNIDCRGFSTLERQIEWKSLGVELPAAGAVRLSPPRAGLLPDVYRRKLMRAASQAHNALGKYSFRFTLCESVWGTSEYKVDSVERLREFRAGIPQSLRELSRRESGSAGKIRRYFADFEKKFRRACRRFRQTPRRDVGNSRQPRRIYRERSRPRPWNDSNDGYDSGRFDDFDETESHRPGFRDDRRTAKGARIESRNCKNRSRARTGAARTPHQNQNRAVKDQRF
jgi:hypothetical protein